jgi:hypothetical protein
MPHGLLNVKYVFSPNGAVMIHISCSDKPFRLVNDDDDIFTINAYIGKVEDRLKNILSGTRRG